MKPMLYSDIKSLQFLHRGKVRDLYAIDDERLLVVQTDRLSAFDVILPDPIPLKGQVLTSLSNFWFQRLGHIVPNHLTGIDPASVVSPAERDQVEGRAMVVRRLKPLMIEAVVRGYVVGSGWKEYQASGTICGIRLPTGLQQASVLPEPIFTPASKAQGGAHDENISFETVVGEVGQELATQLRDLTLAIYRKASDYAATRGLILADTKFEFGFVNGQLVLADEVLTPDSSRYWPADQYAPGGAQPSFDKQFVRDYLESIHWNKQAPAPALPDDVVERTIGKYREAYRLLTGRDCA